MYHHFRLTGLAMNKSDAGKIGYQKSKESLEAHVAAVKQKARDDFDSLNKCCLECGDKIPYEKRRSEFCSLTCAAKFNNTKRNKKSFGVCKFCGCDLKRANVEFCSCVCSTEFKKKERWDRYEEQGSFDMAHTASHNRTIRGYLIHKHGNKCSICQTETWMGKEIVMIVDHIDGNCNNTKIENFRLVCPMCDSQLPTFKGRNRGKGRHYRRDRYKNGKSF